jgi:TFIIF-interacting CTD phosphatase-like protein
MEGLPFGQTDYINKIPNDQRMLLIFDIDETLVYSEEFVVNNSNYDFIVCENVFVKKRPHVDQFLKQVEEMKFDVAIWTAGEENYAKEIAAKLFLTQQLQFIFSKKRMTEVFDSDAPISELTISSDFIKKLIKIWRVSKYKPIWSKKNTLILDDTPFTYSKNYGNGIPIKRWKNETGSKDESLLELLTFLSELRLSADVSKVEKRYWQK